MTEVIKKVDETTPGASPETKETISKSVEAELLEQLNVKAKELEQAQHKIVELKKTSKEDSIDQEEFKKQILEEVKTEHQKEIDKIRAEFASTAIIETLEKLVPDEEERKEVLDVYKTKVVKSGITKEDISKDLEIARIIVTNKKDSVKAEELKKGYEAKLAAGGYVPPTDTTKTDEKQLSSLDKELIRKMGI